jgi:ADP-ribose pyrophosphatase YjhB (NUDIX family)
LTTEHPLTREEFDAIYARVPRLTVEVVLATPGGMVLTRRSIEPCRGQWHLPGGTVWFGESLPAAVRRVARQELGIEVTVGALLGYIEYPDMHRNGYPGWPVGIAFQAAVAAGVPIAGDQSDEVGTFRSVPPDTIREQAVFLRRWLSRSVVPPGGTGFTAGTAAAADR